MKKRSQDQGWLVSVVIVMLGAVMFASSTHAADRAEYVEGIEYQLVRPAQLTSVEKGKVEVVELFWYGCPHCFSFEPVLEKWLKNKPKNVQFIRLPAVFNPSWETHARAYYVAELLGIGDKIHKPFFKIVQKNRDAMSSPKDIAGFFEKHGVSKKKFLSIYNSFAVNTRIARVKNQGLRYGAHSVPTIIVNGKYRSNATIAGGSHEHLLDVVEHLIKMESKKAIK